jgi:hypothetical protein
MVAPLVAEVIEITLASVFSMVGVATLSIVLVVT